jgi:hypothetical protein
LTDKGLAEKERIRIMFVILGGNGTLFHLFWLTCHSGFISADIDTLEEDTICRDSHTLFNLDNVTDNKLRDRYSLSKSLSTSVNSDIFNSSFGN